MIHIILSMFLSSPVTTFPLALLVNADGDGRIFTAVIVDQSSKSSPDKRSLNIICSSGCKSSISLIEEFDDEPLGIFKLSDQNSVIYVTASAGSAYRIRAYLLKETGISRILEVSSLSPPQITTENNKETVSVTIRRSEKSLDVLKESLVWNGGSFNIRP